MLRRCRYGTDHPTPAASTGTPHQVAKERVRGSSAPAEWLGDCAMARNAQLFPIIIDPEHP